MERVVSRTRLLKMLRQAQGKGTARELAQRIGISAPYLSDVFARRREPGPTIQRWLGVTRIVDRKKS